MNTKILRAIQAAAYARADKLMLRHRKHTDAQAHHDDLLRSIIMEDLAAVIGVAIAATEKITPATHPKRKRKTK